MPDYADIYKHARKFPTNFIRDRVPVVDGLHVYPEFPKDLPPDLYAYAYPDEHDPPIAGSLPRFHALRVHHVPLRSTSKLLKGGAMVRDACTALARGPTDQIIHRHALGDASGRSPVLQLGNLRETCDSYVGGPSVHDLGYHQQRQLERDGHASFNPMYRPRPAIGDVHTTLSLIHI